MFKIENVIQLRDGEHIRLVAKRHFMSIFWPLFGAFLLIGIPFFFLFQIFATGPSGLVMFSLLVIAGLFWAWRTFLLWDGNVLIVSTMRVVKATQAGFFSRTVKEINDVDAAMDSSWTKRGLFGFLWNAGTIRLGNGPAIEVKGIPRPHEVFALIQEVSQQARKEQHESRMLRDSRMDRINASLQSLDDTHLKQVEQILKGEPPTAHQQTFDELQVVRKEVPAVESEKEWEDAVRGESISQSVNKSISSSHEDVEPDAGIQYAQQSSNQAIEQSEMHDPFQEYPVEHHHESDLSDQDREPYDLHVKHVTDGHLKPLDEEDV